MCISVFVCTDILLLVSYGSNTEINSTDLPHCNKRYNYPSHALCHTAFSMKSCAESAYGWYADSAPLCILNAVV